MRNISLRTALVFVVIVLFIGAGFVPSISSDIESTGSQSSWWSNDWSNRKELGITDASTDYQMNIEIWKEDGFDNVGESKGCAW